MGFLHSFIRRYERLFLWVLFCLAGIVILKWKVISDYTITTPSMEPTLVGNSMNGDRLAVFKPHYTFFDPCRFDLVVFLKEESSSEASGMFDRAGGMRYVKRLVALPRETVLIKNGDLYLGISPSRLISKTLPMIQEMIIPLYRARFDNTFFMDWEEHSSGRADCFSISSDGLLCHASPETGASSADLLFTTKRGAIYNDYLTEGNRLHEGRYPINDLAMHLEIQPLADSGFLYGELREAGDTFRFQLNSKSAGGGGSLVHEVGTAVAHHIAIPTRLFPGFTPSKTYDLTFMNIDNQVFLLCNSLELAKLSYPENSDLFNSAYKNVPLIGADSTSVLFRKIDFDRDVYYCDDMGTFAVKQPYSIPEGHYFFLGDNSAQSEDSRFFGPIPREDLIGKPFLLFYPFSRIRLF